MKEVVLKSGTVLEADVVVAGIGNIIVVETVLFRPRRTFVLFQGFFITCVAMNALSHTHISVCTSLHQLFGYFHMNLRAFLPLCFMFLTSQAKICVFQA